MSAAPEPWPEYLVDATLLMVGNQSDAELLIEMSRLIWAHEQRQRCLGVSIDLGDGGEFVWDGERFERTAR